MFSPIGPTKSPFLFALVFVYNNFASIMSYDDTYLLTSSYTTGTSTSSTSSISPSSSENSSSTMSSLNSIEYFSDRICQLLKVDKRQYDIIDNLSSSALDSYWKLFGFPFFSGNMLHSYVITKIK